MLLACETITNATKYRKIFLLPNTYTAIPNKESVEPCQVNNTTKQQKYSSDHNPRLLQSPELEGVLAGLPLLEAEELHPALRLLLVAVHGTVEIYLTKRNAFKI